MHTLLPRNEVIQLAYAASYGLKDSFFEVDKLLEALVQHGDYDFLVDILGGTSNTMQGPANPTRL